MLDLGELVLTGKEVVLQPLSIEHAPDLAKASGESRDTYLYNAAPDGEANARVHIEKALEQKAAGERYPFAIYWNGRLVGTSSYYEYQPWAWPEGSAQQRRDAPDVLEIGYTWLAASAQRTRCNSEAKYLLMHHAFENWQVHRVSFRTDERNSRSRNAIQRLGAKFEGIRRGDKPAQDGTVRDSAFFSITIAEWPEVKSRFANLEIDG